MADKRPTPEDRLLGAAAWIELGATGRGRRTPHAAIKRFALSTCKNARARIAEYQAQLRAHYGVGGNAATDMPAPPEVPTVRPDGDDVGAMRYDIALLERDMAAMRVRGSFQALIAAAKLLREMRRDLEAAEKRQAAAWDPYDRDEIVRVVLSLPGWVWTREEVVAYVDELYE